MLIWTIASTFHACSNTGLVYLSMILALRESDEVYKRIKHNNFCRYEHIPLRNFIFTTLCLKILFISVLTLWVFCIILLCGDVHVDPGPHSVGGSTDSSVVSHDSHFASLNNHLSVLHLNVQSIVPKLDLIRSEADLYDILVFSETWLKPETLNESLLIENFRPPYRSDRRGRTGGGVIIYVRDSFPSTRRCDLEIDGLEAVWIELSVKSKRILIGGVYRAPDSDNAYFNLLEESIDRAFNTNIVDLFILGDFNFDLSNNRTNKMTELIQAYGLSQLIQHQTHFTEKSSSLIDLILVRNISNVLTSCVADCFLPEQKRYHCPIVLLLKFLRPSVTTFKRQIWNYTLADYNLYRTLLSEQNLTEQLNHNDDIDENTKLITEAIISAAEQSIPSKTITVRPTELPWLTCKIKNHIRKRKRYYRKFKQTANISFFEKYKTIRNKIVSEIRKSKKDYFEKLDTVLSTETANSKLFWKTAKQVLKLNKASSGIPTLIMNNEYAENDLSKANMLNRFFTSQTIVDDSNSTLPAINRPECSMNQINISIQDVSDVLANLNTYKASGPDLLSPRLLKEGSNVLAEPLTILFNSSLAKCHFPNVWKDANVTPIFKKDDKSSPTNYRPISLLSSIGKVMERCIHKYLYNYAITNELISPLQSGFKQGDSTNFQLLHTYHSFCEAVDRGKEVRVVFCDISKAFDRVWHKGLLHKLSCIGCSNPIVKWFSSYLSNRRQRVVFNGVSSDWSTIHAGVPQGSILGPLLFLIYINDIVKDIDSEIRLFADDTSLYIVIDAPNTALTAANIINNDLNRISIWADDWLVRFNANKTIALLLSRKVIPVHHPHLLMNGTIITEQQSHKHLGIIFSKACTWSEHIDEISKKAWVRLNLLRPLKFRISRKALERMYTSFILPLLEYCDSVWDNASSESKKKLEAIHNEAGRIITGATKLCKIDNLLDELGWDNLQKRRDKHKLIIFFKIMHGLSPNYLRDLVPPLVQETTSYQLRNANDIQTFATNSELFYNSFFPSSVRAWNALPEDIKQTNSVLAFKSKLNANLRRPPKYYNIGTRQGQVLHARLRMECSSLNSHLYHSKIVDSPSCLCGSFESVHHFLFVCPRFAAARNTHLPRNLHNYSTRDLLFGSETKTDQQNEAIFLQVQDFLIHSTRFNNS